MVFVCPLGCDVVVPCSRDPAGHTFLFHRCGYLEYWLHLCGDGTPTGTVSRRFGNRPALPHLQNSRWESCLYRLPASWIHTSYVYVEILIFDSFLFLLNSPDARDWIFHLIWSIPCLLMPWLLKARYGGSNMKKITNGCRLLISCMMEGIKKVNLKNGILWLFSVTDPPKIQDGRHI